MSAASERNLENLYKEYINAISTNNLENLSRYVNTDVIHNNIPLGLERYKALIRDNIVANKMSIDIKRLVADENHVASCLIFTCPEGPANLLGVQTDGAAFEFMENVIYDLVDGKIVKVYSVVDVEAIRARKPR